MIFKKGCKKNRDNYRPISITSCLANVFEKLVQNRIKDHLKKHIILQNQPGSVGRLRTAYKLWSPPFTTPKL